MGDVPYLDVSATIDPNNGTTAIFILNRDLNKAHSVEINFQGNVPSRIANSRVLTGNDLKAVNSFQSPRNVAPQSFPKPTASGGKATVEVPPSSYTVLQWTL
jgi:alpha-L-arabinofuranosidase